MKLKNTLTLIFAAALAACGTVFKGPVQTINFNSNVKNVKIYANGALVCSSVPCNVDIEREASSLTIMAKADGYEDNITQIKTKINPASWGNVSSVYSWTTDFATGSVWQYSRDGIYINMAPENVKKTDLKNFSKQSQIRHFALINYSELKLEAVTKECGEYLLALTSLSQRTPETLIPIINKSQTEPELAHRLTGISL